MVKVQSDGNGGYDINVQKTILRKWGPIGVLIFMLISGLGTNLGSEVLDMVLGREAIEQQVADNKSEIQILRTQSAAQFSEIRQGQIGLSNLMLEVIAADAAKGDDQ